VPHCPFDDRRSVAALVSQASRVYHCPDRGLDRRQQQYEKSKRVSRRTADSLR